MVGYLQRIFPRSIHRSYLKKYPIIRRVLKGTCGSLYKIDSFLANIIYYILIIHNTIQWANVILLVVVRTRVLHANLLILISVPTMFWLLLRIPANTSPLFLKCWGMASVVLMSPLMMATLLNFYVIFAANSAAEIKNIILFLSLPS